MIASIEFHDLQDENKFGDQSPYRHSLNDDPGVYSRISLAYLMYRIPMLNLTLIIMKILHLKVPNLILCQDNGLSCILHEICKSSYPNKLHYPEREL